MSNKCLVTKLGSVVTDSTLQRFGDFKMVVSEPTNNEYTWWLRLDPVEDITIYLKNGYFVDNSDNDLGSEKYVPAGNIEGHLFKVISLEEPVEMVVNSKYDITTISLNIRGYIDDIKASEFQYMTNLNSNIFKYSSSGIYNFINVIYDTYEATKVILDKKYYNFVRVKTDCEYGIDLSWLSSSNHLYTVDIRNEYCTGDINNVASNLNLTSFGFWSSQVTGDWNTFINLQRSYGRTEGLITIDNSSGSNANVTLNGVLYNMGNGTGTIKWDASHILMYNNIDVEPEDEIIKYIYCMGYTDEEIAAWTAAGKVVTKCD